MNASRAVMAPMRRVSMHHEFIIAYDVAGRAFLWRAGCDNYRFLCVRWALTQADVARIEANMVQTELLADKNPSHGNFSSIASAFSFFVDSPDAVLAGFANTLLGKIGTVRGEQLYRIN